MMEAKKLHSPNRTTYVLFTQTWKTKKQPNEQLYTARNKKIPENTLRYPVVTK
jgi:hypothetical protein